MKLVILIAALAAPLAGARADVRPPPIERPVDRTPAEVKAWLSESASAMKAKDMERGKRLCDARGWADNLVGGSGETLESLFSQGARKAWHLAGRFGDTRFLPAGRGVIVRATVEDDESGKELDEVFLLLIRSTEPDGAVRWLALGAGEKLDEVRALADRWLAGQPLAPPDREPAPE